jgi:hypothetical protein
MWQESGTGVFAIFVKTGISTTKTYFTRVLNIYGIVFAIRFMIIPMVIPRILLFNTILVQLLILLIDIVWGSIEQPYQAGWRPL